MQATINRWGNSLALRLPKHVADEARLVEGACVDVELKDGMICLKPTRKKFKLSELLAGEPARSTEMKEDDWGKPAGDEAW